MKRGTAPEIPKCQCPKCGSWRSIVKDGRPDGRGYRRKRQCDTCKQLFFTLERPEVQTISTTHDI